jgi:hypothetical protein
MAIAPGQLKNQLKIKKKIKLKLQKEIERTMARELKGTGARYSDWQSISKENLKFQVTPNVTAFLHLVVAAKHSIIKNITLITVITSVIGYKI